ncbi:hypothetical protein ABH926_002731 [Catenulispora sp. GP43]|uniref:hypothetical protein n=1 Tax=Catenulispora sp. GP43 TaxID=3156263 RepID=UPI003516B8E7
MPASKLWPRRPKNVPQQRESGEPTSTAPTTIAGSNGTNGVTAVNGAVPFSSATDAPSQPEPATGASASENPQPQRQAVKVSGPWDLIAYIFDGARVLIADGDKHKRRAGRAILRMLFLVVLVALALPVAIIVLGGTWTAIGTGGCAVGVTGVAAMKKLLGRGDAPSDTDGSDTAPRS